MVGTRFPPDLFSEKRFKLLHSGIQPRLLSELQPTKSSELDWHSHSLIDCRTLFVNVTLDVLDVSIYDKQDTNEDNVLEIAAAFCHF